MRVVRHIAKASPMNLYFRPQLDRLGERDEFVGFYLGKFDKKVARCYPLKFTHATLPNKIAHETLRQIRFFTFLLCKDITWNELKRRHPLTPIIKYLRLKIYHVKFNIRKAFR